MPSGSRPLTGSSSISVVRVAEQRRRRCPSRWPMPSENWPARLSRDVVQADQVDHLVAPGASGSRASARARAGGCRRERPVCTERASSSAPTSCSGAAVLAVVLAVDGDVARGRRVEAEDQPHRRRLAGAVRAEEAGHDARLDREASGRRRRASRRSPSSGSGPRSPSHRSAGSSLGSERDLTTATTLTAKYTDVAAPNTTHQTANGVSVRVSK